MKLTLGQAAKEAGISKPSLSAAIKKGRLSAEKNDSGVYEIDPAELFRVYPRKTNTDTLTNGNTLPQTNTGNKGVSQGEKEVLGLLLAEKDKAIRRLEEEKDQIRQDLEDQKEQSKRITLLLENKTFNNKDMAWEKSMKAVEARISNQEKSEKDRKDREQKILRQNQVLKKKLEEEKDKNKSFFQKLFG